MLSQRRKNVNAVGALNAAMNALRLAQSAWDSGQKLGKAVKTLSGQPARQPTGVGATPPPNPVSSQSGGNRRRRRRRANNLDQINAPVTTGYVDRALGSIGQSSISSGSEILAVLHDDPSGSGLTIGFNTDSLISLAPDAQGWQEFRFLSLRVWYEPACISTDRGSILMAPLYRPLRGRVTDYDIRKLSCLEGSVHGPIWSSQGMSISYDVRRTSHMWYDTTQYKTEVGRNNTPFYLLLSDNGVEAGLSFGRIRCSYVVQFAHRDIPGVSAKLAVVEPDQRDSDLDAPPDVDMNRGRSPTQREVHVHV